MGKLAPLSRRVLPYRTGDLLTIHLAAGEGHTVTYSHRSRRFDDGVHARAGEQTGTADLNPVVASERLEYPGVHAPPRVILRLTTPRRFASVPRWGRSRSPDELASIQKYKNREVTFRASLARDRTQVLEPTRAY